jgi:hypothetical protein
MKVNLSADVRHEIWFSYSSATVSRSDAVASRIACVLRQSCVAKCSLLMIHHEGGCATLRRKKYKGIFVGFGALAMETEQ